ncbi:unnamed protein product [Fusarium graminearum]|jgi:hypothetical protein|nr:unnamed protein product [Fusarium graminearum]CAG2002934.1 unnamed protein product [Fusarium graminearum]VTO92179.1 unnamed protein product [Fusarium graminearum]
MDRQSRDLAGSHHCPVGLQTVGVCHHRHIVRRLCRIGQVSDHAGIWIFRNVGIFEPCLTEIVSTQEVAKGANGFGAAVCGVLGDDFFAFG